MKSFGKRALALLLSLLMAVSLFTFGSLGETDSTPRFGDINGDSGISAVDALMALQHSVKLIQLEEDVFTIADVDANGKVDATDALYILQYTVKLIDRFPAESEDPGPGGELMTVRVTDAPYLAKGDGETNDRAAIQAAIDAVHDAGGGTVLLDAGKTFVTGNIFLKSNVDLHFEDGAKLKQTADPNAFVELQEDGTYAPFKMTYGHVVYPDREWDVGTCYNYPFLYGRNIKNFKVTGNGIIEMVRGKGCEDTLHIAPVVLYEVDQFELSGFTVQKYNAWAVNCKVTTNGLIKGITIKDATDSAADGIGIVSSQNIRVTECNLTTSDDGIKVSSTYGDPRRGPWIDELIPIPCKNIEIDNNHCVVTWDATKAFAFFVWGSSYPDQTQVEISDVYIHDNYFRTMGIWTGNWNLETGKFEYNGSTSPIKNIRFENNEIGTVQGNFYSVPISDVYGFDCMVSMLNGDFSKGDVYWISRKGGSAGASKDGYGYIDGLDQNDAALYQGIKLLKDAVYKFKADVKTSGQPVRLFVKDQITGELIASRECTATDWETVTLQVQVPKDGNYHVGIEKGEAQSGFAYIDNATLTGEADSAEIPEGENILSTQKPDAMNAGDGIHNMLGVAFSTKVDGVITHVRFYASAQESGDRIVGLWNEDTGEMLLDDYITWNITAGFEGWKYYKLPKPVHVTAGTAYIVGVSCGTYGKYSKGTGQMATAFENGNLVTYNQSGRWRDIQNFSLAMPEHTGPSHYFRDIVFLSDEAQVSAAVSAIDALPESVGIEDKEAVEAARAAYDALVEEQKAQVQNLSKLTDAEARIVQLEEEARIDAENKAKADAVTAAIDALPESVDLGDKEAVDAARAAYDGLTEDQKALVQNLSKLTDAEARIQELLEEAQQDAENKERADAVTAIIGALPESVGIEDKEAVEAARAAYDGLTDEQKALVQNLSKLTGAEARIAQLEEEARVEAENKAKADAVIAAINALPATADVTLEDAEAVEAARVAYDGLTDEQKALVQNLAKLTEAEERIKKLKEANGISIYTTQTPADPNHSFGGPRLFMGTRFAAKVNGAVTKVRAYIGTKESGIHYVGLWEYDTATLVSAQVYEWDITAGTEGWQEFTLPQAVSLEVGKQYVVAVSAGPNGYGAQTPSAQTVFPIENDYLTTDITKSSVWADMASNGQKMPNKASGEYYFRDIIFVPDGVQAEKATAAIDALPETIGLQDKEAVEAARAAYDALTERQKALVQNLSKLTDAEIRIAQLEEEARVEAENKAKADAVTVTIGALPETIELVDKDAVEAARAAYEALTDEQKALVQNLSKLTDAEARIQELLEEAQQDAENKEKADAVTAIIGALPETIELVDKDAVEAARAAYDGLTDEQKALVQNLAKLTGAEARIAQLEEEARVEAENKAKADAVIAAINALPATADVTLEDAEAVEAARTAYEALTDEQKALVNNLAKLTEVEERIKKLKEANGISIYTTQTPSNTSDTFGGVRNFLGTRFSPKVDGTVTKVRLYTGAQESGIHYVGLWEYETGTLVSAQVYEWDITAGTEGWQEFTLPQAVSLEAGKWYVVAVSAGPNKYAVKTPSSVATFPLENDYLVTDTTKSSMWADMSVNGQNMPNNKSGEYYFRDIVFVPGGTSAPEEPEPEDPAPEAESVSIYTTQTPADPNHSFGGPRLFMGTRFTAKVSGTVTKVRAYIGSKEEGTHYVGLWDYETGTLITAQVYEWNITAGTEGWQEFALPEAVSLEAGKQYVVAVSAGPNGYGAQTPSAQTVFPIENDYLTTDTTKSSVWADMSVNGQNMPTGTSGEYYFRDIVFVPNN